MAPVKKRPLVPILLGTIVVLGGGAAAAKMLMFGPKADGSAVPPDTAQHLAASDPTRSRILGNTKAPSRPEEHVITHRGQESSKGGRPTLASAGLDSAKIGDLLIGLIERPAPVILDSALIAFNSPGIGRKDKGFAACLMAQAYNRGNDTANALKWASTGLGYDSGLSSCRDLEQSLGRH
jgi:hypothetical protein